jgi:phosphoserine phosphatase
MSHNDVTHETRALRQILEVTRKLAAPFDLDTMLSEVVSASLSILNAERGTVFLYDEKTDELVVRVATELGSIRIPADKGVVGESARTRKLINVPDCYADPRFNRDIDRKTGYRSRCMLTIPLIGYEDSLVGVLQILNKKSGTFDEQDEFVASALAAQAAVVLHRVKLTEAMIVTEKLDREITVARDVQMGTLPKVMPQITGYDVAGTFSPTDQTGGDLFDFVKLDDSKLFLLMGDATGHGIGPALSATQVRAMLRVALRLGASLDDAFVNVNDQLVEDLPDDRFVTAFFGLLDTNEHVVQFHSGGQGPIMHFHAASNRYDWHEASTFPLGYMNQTHLGDATTIEMGRGDILGLISDGIYEYENAQGVQFGQEGIVRIIGENPLATADELVRLIMFAARQHGGTVPQADDITIVLVRRLSAAPADVAA